MRLRIHPIAAAGALAVPAAGVGAYLVHACHALVAGTAVVLELLSRSF